MRWSAFDVDRLGIRSVPSDVANTVIAHECMKAFGPETLRASNLFYKVTRAGGPCFCLEWSDQCVCAADSWRLAVDYYQRGLLMPVRHRRYGYYEDLLVYRHTRDARPFSVSLQAERAAVA